MKTIQIGNVEVGGNHTFVIAEIGSNHNQSLDLAYETIDAAVEAGADAVKFQSILIDKLYYDPSPTTVELHKRIDMDEAWHYQLKDYCDKKDIIFFSSPTYISSIKILEEMNVQLHKLASAQIGTFPQLVEEVARLNKPTILSTGMVSFAELEKNIQIFKRHNNDQYIILHCNSIYPTPYERVNLHMVETYRQMFGCITGFSDHTLDIYIPIAAVARGAKVIEKHFSISRQLPVPDAPFSLEPEEFKKMVEGIRATEKALAEDHRTYLQPEEKQFKEAILSRLVLKHPKKTGELFSRDDFEFLRHPSGVDCRDLDHILRTNKKAAQDLDTNTLLSWDMIK